MIKYCFSICSADGLFVIPKVPSGSYVIDVISGNYVYEPVRVEINSKGKYRARKVNYLQTSQITPVSYPLKMKPLGYARYFQTREQWRLTDLLFNPMVCQILLFFKEFIIFSRKITCYYY